MINLYLNTRELPFSDVRFRQALSMSLDRPLIVDLAAYGYPTVETNVTGIGEYFKPYFNEEVNAKYAYLAKYNPDQAMALLEEADISMWMATVLLKTPTGHLWSSIFT